MCHVPDSPTSRLRDDVWTPVKKKKKTKPRGLTATCVFKVFLFSVCTPDSSCVCPELRRQDRTKTSFIYDRNALNLLQFVCLKTDSFHYSFLYFSNYFGMKLTFAYFSRWWRLLAVSSEQISALILTASKFRATWKSKLHLSEFRTRESSVTSIDTKINAFPVKFC